MKVILIFVVLLFPKLLYADDGNKLLQRCTVAVSIQDGSREDGELVHASYCLGFMAGILNLNRLYEVQLKTLALFCLPPATVTNGQGARIVLRYLRDHPEKLHEHEIALAVLAFREAFPCQK